MRLVVQKRILIRLCINMLFKLMSWLNIKKVSCWRFSGCLVIKFVIINDVGIGNFVEQLVCGVKQQLVIEMFCVGCDLCVVIVVGFFIGLVFIVVLVFVLCVWVVIVVVVILVVIYEVVWRLWEVGYFILVILLLIGGQVVVWLIWLFGVVGVLVGFGGMVVVCMIW